MSKKRVQFDIAEDHESNKQENNQDEEKLPFNKKFKHTLDSDEEDDEIEDEKKYEFNAELFEGEEEGNLHNEGEITITPFNVKDELQEGHFDDQGTFIFKKDKDEIKDNWIDNIDWTKVKDSDNKEDHQKTDDQSSEDEDTDSKFDSDDCLKKLLELMEPNETVQKAMQRLGKSKNNNKNRNQQKKDKKTAQSTKDDDEEKQRKVKLNSLIELSNLLLNDGDMDIYEKKYERIKYQLDENLRKKSDEQQSTSANDNLDIFAD